MDVRLASRSNQTAALCGALATAGMAILLTQSLTTSAPLTSAA